MEFNDYLRILVNNDGSDLYLTADAPPAAKFQGALKPIENKKLTKEDLSRLANGVMDEEQRLQFEKKPEMNLAISVDGIGRFRINIYQQRNCVAMVIRNIKVEIPNAEKLGLPNTLKKVIMEKRGLVMFVGGTGSGKSTSLAALIDHRNRTSAGHIITIEDPIEYVHPHKKSIISQREVGVDTDSYEDALHNTLRQAPDVILIGEVRTEETMEHALAFAETGHLCLTTLHANNANQALDRIINFFPEERHKQLLLDLSLNIQAFISQRLVPTIDGKRVAAIEVLLGTQLIRELIQKGDIGGIKEVMEKSEELGMQTFDAHLFRLYKEGIISLDVALSNADSPNNLQVRINLDDNPAASMMGDPDEKEEDSKKEVSNLSKEQKAFNSLALEAIEEEKEEETEEEEFIFGMYKEKCE